MSYADDGLGTAYDWELNNPNGGACRMHPPFEEYEATVEPETVDPEGHRAYSVKLLRYRSYHKMCQAVVQPVDGKSYYIEFRCWSFPVKSLDDEDSVGLVRRAQNDGFQWSLNRHVFGYGPLSDNDE